MSYKDKIDDIRFRKIVQLSKVKHGDNVLDIGCADKKILKYLPNVNYIGIDKRGSPDILCDLEKKLPKISKKFDVIFMIWFLEEVENYKTVLRWCKSLLKADGRIMIMTPSHNRLIIGSEWEHTTHCFRPTNIDNIAKMLRFKIVEKVGIFIHIPIFNLIIPCSSMIYNNAFLFVLKQYNP